MPRYNIATAIPAEIRWVFQAGGPLYPAATNPANHQETFFDSAALTVAQINIPNEDKAAAVNHAEFDHGTAAGGAARATFGGHLYGAWQHHRLSSGLQTSIDGLAAATPVNVEQKAYLERFKRLVDTNRSRVAEQLRTHGDLTTPANINTQKGYLEDVTAGPNNTKTKQTLANQMLKLGLIEQQPPPVAPGTGDPNHPEVLDFFAEREFYLLIQGTNAPAQQAIQKALLDNKEFIKTYLKMPGVGHDECAVFLATLQSRGNAAGDPNHQALKDQLIARLGTVPAAAAHIESMTAMIFAEGEYIHLTNNRDRLGTLAAGWTVLHGMAIDRPTFIRSISTAQPPITTRAAIDQIITELQSGNATLDQLKVLMGKLGLGGSPVNDNLAKQLFAEVQYNRLVADQKLIPAGHIRTQITGARTAQVKAAILAAVTDPVAPITTPAGINKLVKDIDEAKSIDDLKGTPPGAPPIVGPLQKLGLIDPITPASTAAADAMAGPIFAANVIRTLTAPPSTPGALPADSHVRRLLDDTKAPGNIIIGAETFKQRFLTHIATQAGTIAAAPGDFECRTLDQALRLAKLDSSNPHFNVLTTLTPEMLLEPSFPPPPHPQNPAAITGHPGYLRALGSVFLAHGAHVLPGTGVAFNTHSLNTGRIAKEIYAEIQFERELKRIQDATPPAEHPSVIYRTLKSKKEGFIAAVVALNPPDPIFVPAPDEPGPPAPLGPAPVGSLRELFDNIYGDRPRAGAAPAPEGKDLNGNGGILHAMQVLGLAGGALGAQGGVPAAQAAADLKNAEVFFKQAQFNRLVRELKERHRTAASIAIAGLDPTIQADLTARANTGALSDSLDDLLIRKKSTPGRNFLQRLGVVNTVADVNLIRDNQFRDLRDETKSTADIAGLMDGLQLIAANDPNLAEVKQQFADVQFRWLVKKAAQEQSDRHVATFAPGQNLYEMLVAPQTRDALKRFLMNFTTHAEVENFYKMLSTKKGDELRIYLLSVLRDGTPAEKMTLTATVMRAVTSLPHFQPSVSNNEYLDLIENPFIREMLRKRGDYFGKNDKYIKFRIEIFNEQLRNLRRAGMLTDAQINGHLGRLFRRLKNDLTPNPSAPPATYGETVVNKGTHAAVIHNDGQADDLIVAGGADVLGPPVQFSLTATRSMPALAIVAPGGAGVATLNDMQASINEFFIKFARHAGGALANLDYATVAARTKPQNILLRDILIRRGLRGGGVANGGAAGNEWYDLRTFEWATGSYADLLDLIRPILHADDRAKNDEQILSEQEFQRIKAYHRNRDIEHQDDAKQMIKEWTDISTPKPSYNPYKSSFERVQTLLSVIDSQVSRIRGAYPVDGSQPDLKVCQGLDLKVEKENREKSLIEVNELIRVYELRLEEQKARHKLFFEDLKSDLLDHGVLVNEQRALVILTGPPHRFSNDHARKVYKTIREGSATLDALRQSTERTLEGLKERRDALTVMETQLSSIEALVKSMKDSKEYVVEAVVSDPLELKGATYTAQLDEISQYIATRRGEVEHDHLAAAVAGPTTARRQGVEFKKPIVSFTRSLTAIVDIAMGDSKYATQETRFYTADSKSELSSISKSMASKLHSLATAGGGNPDLQALIQAITGVAHTDGAVLKKLTSFFRNYESHLTKDLIDLNLLEQFLMTAIAEKGGDPAHVQNYNLHQQLFNACVSDVANDKCIQMVDGVQRPSRKLCEEAWIAVNHYFDTHPGATELPIASASNRVFGVALKQAFILYESIHRKENAAKGIKLHCTDKSGLMYEAPKTRWFSLDVFKTEQEYFRSHFNPIIKASHDPRAKIRAAEKRTDEVKKQSEVLTDVEQHMPTRPRVR